MVRAHDRHKVERGGPTPVARREPSLLRLRWKGWPAPKTSVTPRDSLPARNAAPLGAAARSYPPQWEIKRDLAYSYAKIGVFLSAAAMFEELGLWDEVVSCFKLSGKHNKAQALVEKRLELDGPTPEMLAALGDLTDDPVHWTKAWELSHAR